MKILSSKKAPKAALIIVTPGLGDALLATPILKSLKNTHPGIEVDFLVHENAAPILKDISEIRNIYCFEYKNKIRSYFKTLKNIWRKYDIAISCKDSDRSILFSFYAAPIRVGLIPNNKRANFWKKIILSDYIVLSSDKHTINLNAELAKLLNLKISKQTVFPKNWNINTLKNDINFDFEEKDFVVLHCFPSVSSKKWPTEHWETLIKYFAERNIKVVLTGGSSVAEREFSAEMQNNFPDTIINAVSKLDFSELSLLLKNSSIYIGVDTVVGHLAASIGTPLICLFGSSNIRRWSPWPKSFDKEISPFNSTFGIQQIDSVIVIQGKCFCSNFPTKCSRDPFNITSECMKSILPSNVISAVETLMKDSKPKSSKINKNSEACLII